MQYVWKCWFSVVSCEGFVLNLKLFDMKIIPHRFLSHYHLYNFNNWSSAQAIDEEPLLLYGQRIFMASDGVYEIRLCDLTMYCLVACYWGYEGLLSARFQWSTIYIQLVRWWSHSIAWHITDCLHLELLLTMDLYRLFEFFFFHVNIRNDFSNAFPRKKKTLWYYTLKHSNWFNSNLILLKSFIQMNFFGDVFSILISETKINCFFLINRNHLWILFFSKR